MAEAVRQELSALAAIFCGPHEWEMLSCSGEYPVSHPAATAGSRGTGSHVAEGSVGGEQRGPGPPLGLPSASSGLSPQLTAFFIEIQLPEIVSASSKHLCVRSLTARRYIWLSGPRDQCQPHGRQAANVWGWG